MSTYVLVFRFNTETDKVAEEFAQTCTPLLQSHRDMAFKDSIEKLEVAITKVEAPVEGE